MRRDDELRGTLDDIISLQGRCFPDELIELEPTASPGSSARRLLPPEGAARFAFASGWRRSAAQRTVALDRNVIAAKRADPAALGVFCPPRAATARA
jgi:hypothetical protein